MKKLALSLFFLFQVVLVMAQSQSIVKGKIVDSKTQTPIGGVKVMVQLSEQSVVTNNLGDFSYQRGARGRTGISSFSKWLYY